MEFADGPSCLEIIRTKLEKQIFKRGVGLLRKCVPYRDNMANLGRRAYKEKILQKNGQGLGKDV